MRVLPLDPGELLDKVPSVTASSRQETLEVKLRRKFLFPEFQNPFLILLWTLFLCLEEDYLPRCFSVSKRRPR